MILTNIVDGKHAFGFDFPWVLRNVGLAGMDSLVDRLQKDGSLAAARLACRALRDAIDGSVRDVHIKILPGDYEPSLQRWHRCTSVTVCVSQAAACAAGRDTAAALLLLPFSCLSPQRRLRITRFLCVVEGLDRVEITPLSFLALWLPSVQELQLHNVHLAYDPIRLLLLNVILASMKQLKLLSLPSYRALEGIGALGSSLRRLEVWELVDHNVDGPALQAQALAGLSNLRCLQHLTFVNYHPVSARFDADACVAFLTARLPPSLEHLELRACQATHYCRASVTVALSLGQIRSVLVMNPGCSLQYVLQLANKVLLPGLQRAGEQQLEQLTIGDFAVSADYVPSAEHLVPILMLRKRFRRVELGTLGLGECDDPQQSGGQLQTAWLLTSLLATPQALHVGVKTRVVSSTMQLQYQCSGFSYYLDAVVPLAETDAQQSPCGESAGGAAVAEAVEAQSILEPQPQPAALPVREEALVPFQAPNASDILRAALDSMVQVAVSAVAAMAGTSRKGNHSDGNSEMMEIVLLRGPFVASLCRTPGVALSWLRLLEWHVATSGASGGRRAPERWAAYTPFQDRGLTRHIRAYQLLPTAGAMLVACEERVAHTLAAAATEAAALQRNRLATAGLPAGGDEALEVVPLWVKWTWSERSSPAAPMTNWLLYHVGKVVQPWWQRNAADSIACVRRAFMYSALKCALQIRDGLLQELPPTVILQ